MLEAEKIMHFSYFIAGSTNEESVERWKNALTDFIYGIVNQILSKRGISLDCHHADHGNDAILEKGTLQQDKINKEILECDFFYALVDDEMRQYTWNELCIALEHQSKTGKPTVRVYVNSAGNIDESAHYKEQIRMAFQLPDEFPLPEKADTMREALDEVVNNLHGAISNLNESKRILEPYSDNYYISSSNRFEHNYRNFSVDEINNLYRSLGRANRDFDEASAYLHFLYVDTPYNDDTVFGNYHSSTSRKGTIRDDNFASKSNMDKIRALDYYRKFDCIDSIKLSMLLALERRLSELSITNAMQIKFCKGNVIINGEAIPQEEIDLKKIPLYREYPGRERLERGIEQLKESINRASPIERVQIAYEIQIQEENLARIEKTISELCFLLYLMKSQPMNISSQTKIAIQAIEEGQYNNALENLRDECTKSYAKKNTYTLLRLINYSNNSKETDVLRKKRKELDAREAKLDAREVQLKAREAQLKAREAAMTDIKIISLQRRDGKRVEENKVNWNLLFWRILERIYGPFDSPLFMPHNNSSQRIRLLLRDLLKKCVAALLLIAIGGLIFNPNFTNLSPQTDLNGRFSEENDSNSINSYAENDNANNIDAFIGSDKSDNTNNAITFNGNDESDYTNDAGAFIDSDNTNNASTFNSNDESDYTNDVAAFIDSDNTNNASTFNSNDESNIMGNNIVVIGDETYAHVQNVNPYPTEDLQESSNEEMGSLTGVISSNTEYESHNEAMENNYPEYNSEAEVSSSNPSHELQNEFTKLNIDVIVRQFFLGILTILLVVTLFRLQSTRKSTVDSEIIYGPDLPQETLKKFRIMEMTKLSYLSVIIVLIMFLLVIGILLV